MRAGKMTLGKRIALLVVLGLALTLSLFGFLSLRSLQESSDRALRERLTSAQLTARHIDGFIKLYIDSLDQSLNSAPADLLDLNSNSAVNLLSHVYGSGGGVSHAVYLVDFQGRLAWAEPAAERSRALDPSLLTFIRTVIDGAQAAVSNAYRDELGRTLFAVAVPVRDGEGRSIGALVRVQDLTDPLLSDFVQPVSLGASGYADMVDSSGLVMASSLPSRLFSKSDHTDQFAAMISDGRPTVGGCHNCHESPTAAQVVQPDILAFAPLSSAPWGIAIRQSEEEVLGPTRDLQRSLALASLLTLFISIGMVMIGTRVVVWPVRQLIVAARRIADGDLDSRVDSTGPAEVGELATAFDEMRDRLSRSLNNLEMVNSNLELRVEQRTRELSALLDVSKLMASSLEVRQLMETVVARTRKVLRLANAGFVALHNERMGRLEVRANWGYQDGILRLSLAPGEGPGGKAFLEGRATRLESADVVREAMASLNMENRTCLAMARQDLPPTTSILALPLVARGRVTGAMVLEHHTDDQAFSLADLRLAQALADQIALAAENARLYQEVLEKERIRGELLDKVIVAQEDERRRIARELHDDTCQSLAALAINLEGVEVELPETATSARAGLSRIKAQLRSSIKEVRTMALNLRPSMLDDLGLILAIDWYAKEQIAPRGVEVSLEVDGDTDDLPPAVETVLFRIAQEALTNAVKHSGADAATVRIYGYGTGVVLEVEDDGLGFDVDRVLGPGRPPHSLGLHGMMERANLSGGTLLVQSNPGRGTRIRVELPLQGARENGHENHHGTTVGRS